MENIKELKSEAYDIATAKTTNGWGETSYRWSVDVRTEAMKVYALLAIAEKLTAQNESAG